ncbi:MAG TPA: acyl-CoA dehydrogenase family protein [Acidimicrobiales bacterium]|nr:acyl-CoA dehydrogenase family protein [Acidimicrobiales bacterium]
MNEHDAVASARRMAGPVAERSTAIEAAGRLPADVVAELRASGLLGLWLPAELGGAEAPAVDVVDAIAALAAADGSTGWCAAVSVSTGVLAAYLPEEGAREVFATPSTITGGSLNPAGRATATTDGYRISGRWGFGSGASHADWMCGACLLVDDAGELVTTDEGRPEALLAMLPTSAVTIADTWHTSGLRATASHDFEIEAFDVPRRHTMGFAFTPWPTGPMWRIPPMPLFFAPMAAVALGIARGAIDDLVDLARVKTPYRSSRRLAERDVIQSMVARAEAATRSGRAFLLEALDGLAAAARRGDEITLVQRAIVRVAAVNATQAGMAAVDLCFEAAGTTALFSDHPLQRRHRDVHAVGQHVVLAFPGYETAGRVLLGLEPDTALL